MLTPVDTNVSLVFKYPLVHTAQHCPHLSELLKLTERVRQIEYEFSRYRLTAEEEKSFLERQIKQLRVDKEREVQVTLTQCHSPSTSLLPTPNHHFTVFTDALLAEKNNEIASLRQKLSELMDANRRLNVLQENRAFEKESETAAHRLDVKEKDLVIQRLRNDLERHVEQNSKLMVESRRLTDELATENTTLRQTIDVLNSKVALKENQLHKEQERAKGVLESELNQTRNCFDMRLKHRVEMASQNLMDLAEHEATKKLKQSALNLWVAKFKARVHLRDATDLQKQVGIFKVMSRVRDVALHLSEETVQNLYRVFHRSVVAANKKKANSFGVFIQNFKEALNTTNVYKRTLMQGFYWLNELLAKHSPDERLREETRQLTPDLFDKPNRAIFDGLVEIEGKLRKRVSGGKQDENERFLVIYQLFMVMYRAEYPINRDKVEVEGCVKEVLNAMVFEQLKRLIGD